MKKQILVAGALAGMMLTTAISTGYAADFTVNTGVTDNSTKMLSADNEIGAIQTGGILSTSASPAIIAGGLNQRINNAGTIETTNVDNPAIMFAGSASTGTIITNSSIIRTTGGGSSAHAIQITPSAPGVMITNTGTLSASGTGNAVRFVANNNTLSNSGTITTTGSDAIFVNGDNNRIVLNAGTSLTGGINFAGGTGNVLEYTMGRSCPLQGGLCTSGLKVAPTITAGTLGVEYTQSVTTLATSVLPANAQIVTDGNKETIVTVPTLIAVKTQKIIGLLGAVTAEMAESMGRGAGATTTVAGQSTGNPYGAQGHWWLEGYGSYRERPQHSDQSYSENRNGGIVGGYDFPKADNGTYYGVYASVFTGTTDMGKPVFRTIDSNGALVGGRFEKSMDAYTLGGHLIAGFSSNDSDRIVGGGSGVARADYNDYFVSPRITVSRPFESQSGYVWTPSVTAGYVFSYAEGFAESGSLANQSVDSKTSHAITGRAQMELALPRQDLAKSGTLNTSFRVGVEGMTGIGDNDINARVLGTSVTITPDTERSIDAILGVKFDLDVTDTVQFYLDGEAAIGLNNGGTSDNKGGTARAGLKWSF